MFEGHFDVTKYSTRGLQDGDFTQSIEAGHLLSLLSDLPIKACAIARNRIFDNMAGYVLDKLFSLGDCTEPFYRENSGPASALAFICLMTTDADTTSYTEEWGTWNAYSRNIHNVSESANTDSGGKRFKEDQVENYSIWADTLREAVYFSNKFLYLPSQGISNDIRSIGIFFASQGDDWDFTDYYASIGRIGRVRLKDKTGQKVILTKNSNEALLVEYTFSLVNV